MLFQTKLEHLIAAGFQLIYVPTTERSRCEEELQKLANKLQLEFVTWDGIDGLSTDTNAKDPITALQAIEGSRSPKDQLIVMRNLHVFLEDPIVRQIVHNLYYTNKLSNDKVKRPIVIIAPIQQIHEEISSCITVVEYTLPDQAKLTEVFNQVADSVEIVSKEGTTAECTDEIKDKAIQALRGLTTIEAENILAYSLRVNRGYAPTLIDTIEDQKSQCIQKSEVLTYVPKDSIASMDDIGGYENLKDFIKIRNKAYTKQARDLNIDLPRGVVLLGVPGTAKCFQKGTEVLMYDGSVKVVEKVKKGDILIGPDSKPRKVLSTTRGHGELYKVTPVKGNPYVVNGDHVLSLKKSGKQAVTNISVNEYLQRGDGWKGRMKGWRTGVDWASREVMIPPYILGIWLGDGTSKEMAVTTPDAEVITELHTYAASVNLGITVQYKAGCGTYRITGGRNGGKKNPAVESLRAYSLLNNKHIPKVYLINDRKTRLALLAGLIDSDGTLDESNTIGVVTIRKQLCDDILFLARSLGFAAYATYRQKICTNNGKAGMYYHISISGELSEIPTRIPRKQAAQRKQIKSVNVTGITVTSVGPGDYYGFEVDGDHLFLLSDFTVTHNSMCAKITAREFGLPLIIMNIGAVYGSLVGESERRIRTALNTIDALDGSVVLVDEAEKALGGADQAAGDSGVSRRVFGTLLTWLTEKKSRTFVVMTMNRTRGIPPEFLRRGRFDQIFYTDIPDPIERDTILRIHCKKRGVDTKQLNTPEWGKLIDITNNFVGAELEQIVCDARFDAFANRSTGQPTVAELINAATQIKPLADAEKENIEDIRRLCEGYACPVSIKRHTQVKKTRAVKV